MAGELGKASLDPEANLYQFKRNLREGEGAAGSMRDSLDAIAAVARIAENELNRVKLDAKTTGESSAAADRIEASVGRVGRAAMEAAEHLGNVKLGTEQAAETEAAGDVIDRKLKDITGNANETRRALESVRLTGTVSLLGGAGGGGNRNPGAGVGPFGSGFGRIGVLGAGIGAGVLTGPAAGPALAGLAAAIPAFAGVGAGALGTLALAFDGVTKAIGGDKKAFDDLGPSAQQFVQTVRSLDGWFDKLRQTAGSSLFPGLTEGLKSALSPSTVGAVTNAVREFGTVIGQAGAAWGKYFGSAEFTSIFGPVMAAGATNLGRLASAALSLFDALGVLGRAAIPLTTWLSTAAEKAANLADSWLHAKDISGQLAGAMGEAETSLRLVGNLLLSVGNAVEALGAALYPLSKIAVKDLTDGLNTLAGLIRDNQNAIREIVGTAFTGLVTVVKVAAGAVSLFTEGLQRIVGSKATIITTVLAIGAAITLALGPESAAITGALLAVGLIEKHWTAVKDFFKTLGQYILNIFDYVWVELQRGALKAALAVVEPFSHLPSSLGSWARKAKDSMQTELGKLHAPNMDWSTAAAQAGTLTGNAWSQAFQQATVQVGGTAGNGGAVPKRTSSPASSASTSGGSGKYSSQQVYKLLTNAGFSASDASNFVGIAQAESGYNPRALNNNPSTGDYSVGLFQENFYKSLGPARTQRYAPMFGLSRNTSPTAFVAWLQQHPAAQAQIAYDLFSSSGYQPWMGDAFVKAHPELLNQDGSGVDSSVFGTPPPFTTNTGQPTAKQAASQKAAAAAKALAAKLQIPVTNDQALVARYKTLAATANTGPAIAKYLDDETAALKKENVALAASMQGKTAVQKATIRKQIAANDDTITKIHASIVQAIDMKSEAGLFGQFTTRLAASTAKFNTDTARASILSGSYLDAQHETILADAQGQAATLEREKNVLSATLKTSAGKFAVQVKGQLASVTSKIAQVQQTVVQSLAQIVQDAQSRFSTALTALQTAADNQLQAQLASTIAKLGVQFFQGGQTPLEKQLADMQAQDQLQSLQDAVASATDDKTRAAAQRQLDEYNLSIQAAAERAKADSDYAAQVKQATDDEARRQANLDAGLQTYSDQLLNTGQSTVTLASLFDAAGVSVAELALLPGSPFDALNTAAGELTAAFLAYASKLGGSSTTAAPYTSPGAQARAGIGVGGALNTITGTTPLTAARLNFLQHSLPSLDIGGKVVQSGVAMVHRGEFFTGVHGEAVAGAGVHVNVNGFVGNEAELATQIGRLLQKANERGTRFNIR